MMKSIALKLWLGMMALVSVVLILLWLFQVVFLGKFYKDIRISDIKAEGFSLIKVIEQGNYVEFEVKAEEFVYNHNAAIELIDLNNNTLYSTGTPATMGMHGHMGMGMMKNNPRAQVYEQVLKGKTEQISVSHPRFGSETIVMGFPIIIAAELQGAFLIELPIAPVEDTVKILKQQLYYIIIILLIAALLFSFLLSRSFTTPIVEIIKVSEKMAHGDLNARVAVMRQDEIGKLATTINDMGTELSKIDQLRKDLIANVSHELRTPLSLIKGYAETIRDISGNNLEKREKHIEVIIEESDRLSSIVDDILRFSQMEAEYAQIEKGSFIINHILKDAVKRYEIESEKRSIKLSLELDKDMVVMADEAKIKQVIYNLLNNAMNHSVADGTITISTTLINDKVKVAISDTGEGIPKDEIKYIWDRFYKADKSGKRNKAGTGLGLAIVKNILLAHQLEYGVESQKGVGTTFWFIL